MPTDHVKNRTFKEVFSGTVRFRIPFFQRGYAWERKQWDVLFSDIEEQVIDEVESGSSIDHVEHFFGPIVVMEQSGIPEVKEFLVIDGQQRLTTVYLLLGFIRDHIKTKKHLSGDAGKYIQAIDKQLTNEVEGNDDYLKLKIFPQRVIACRPTVPSLVWTRIQTRLSCKPIFRRTSQVPVT